ncbi:unnamed protein product [marine sediment metagenome]|uniref:Uncharacterized protein n=1 Tax=marine sediment metagenome TaxID=412755 RepID=X1QQJ7_9ZZZZ
MEEVREASPPGIATPETLPGHHVHGDKLSVSHYYTVQENLEPVTGADSPKEERIGDAVALRAQTLCNLALL